MNPQHTRAAQELALDDLCEVVITAPDRTWLEEFARLLISDRLCAGTHITQIHSLYPWEGSTQEALEARAAMRTRRSLVPEILELTLARHPYQVPSLVVVPLIAASPNYADWIRDNTRADSAAN
ncbi:divalent-cation tolerance protein CutA [Kineosporia sp. R_H_3]|uniref:divalent-cation tolerance protein CutA n=1 Tax=Kineosporia sp. R_H_3 TaxID=1961848 RepID=UPI000B4A942E|nr:divalent-cation tolerance protein CutA [Kineosporia sp. R_H_3]